jgi:hypothetical protein
MAVFTEPTRRLALRWGTYRGRYLAGLMYVAAGTVILLSSNTYSLGFLLVGTVAHVAGWFVLPATGARRLIAFGPSLIAIFLLLTGPQIMFAMAAVLFGWLLVRERPIRSYVVLLFPIFSGVLMAYSFHSNHDVPVAFGIECVVVGASAWLARFLATTHRPKPVRGPNRPITSPF